MGCLCVRPPGSFWGSAVARLVCVQCYVCFLMWLLAVSPYLRDCCSFPMGFSFANADVNMNLACVVSGCCQCGCVFIHAGAVVMLSYVVVLWSCRDGLPMQAGRVSS